MYPLGHLGTGLIVASLLSMPVAAFVFGVFLPDVVDKGLTILGVLECSRSFAHNVFFAMGAGAAAFAATRNRKVGVAVMLGCMLHLAQDSAHFVPYFYPLVDYEFVGCGPVKYDPGQFEIAMEFVGAALIVVWWKYRAKLIYLGERIIKSGSVKSVSRKSEGKLRRKKV